MAPMRTDLHSSRIQALQFQKTENSDLSYRQSHRLFVRILTAQPEPMGGSRAGSLTLGPMGRWEKGLCLRGYTSVNIKVISIK